MHNALDWLAATAPRARLVADSRRIKPGDVFVAQPGHRSDGRAFIDVALASGAQAVLFEAQGAELRSLNVPTFGVDDLASIAGPLASKHYGDPSGSMLVFAVTGTNGKTTCASWLAQALAKLDRRCALVGTLGAGFADALDSTGLTTPDVWRLHETLRDLREQGADALAIEASSIGLDQGRLDGVHIDVAMFTNLTRDHLDYHGSMAEYEAAKAVLFDWPGLRAAIVNADDEAAPRLAARAQSRGVRTLFYSIRGARDAELSASAITSEPAGMRFNVECTGAAPVEARLASLGDHNVANWLACATALVGSGFTPTQAFAAMNGVRAAEGRLEPISEGEGPLVVVDYAHTPDALDHALAALRPVTQLRGGQLVALFGCGGDRDHGKRPLMAAAAARHADVVALTSDNPRREDPRTILDEIRAGLPSDARYWIEADRRTAIRRAIAQADVRDVVLVAGKGHERTQDIGGDVRPFYDPDEVRAAQRERRAKSEVRV